MPIIFFSSLMITQEGVLFYFFPGQINQKGYYWRAVSTLL
jgi:hypothetical protein